MIKELTEDQGKISEETDFSCFPYKVKCIQKYLKEDPDQGMWLMSMYRIYRNVVTLSGILLNCLAVRNCKKIPNQETGLGNRGCPKVLNDTKWF